MSGLMGGGGGAQSVNTTAPIISGLRLQTSSYGRPIAWGMGKSRVAANLIWYGDFTPIPHTTTSSGGGGGSGGKGGGDGGGGGSTNTTYTYTAAMLLALGRGVIGGVPNVWRDKEKTTLAALGLTLYTGNTSQTAFPHISTNHPTEALAYRGLAYVAHAAMDLGDNAQLRNHSFEVQWPYARGTTGQSGKVFTVDASANTLNATAHGYTLGMQLRLSTTGTLPAPADAARDYYVINPAANTLQVSLEPNGAAVDFTDTGSGTHTMTRTVPDADPKDLATVLVTDADLGVGLASGKLGSLASFSAYCIANGIVVSPAFVEQAPAAEILQRLAIIGNSEVVWSENLIKIVPYSDVAATGNGATFTPNVTPVFELTDDDFTPAEGEDPVTFEDLDTADAYNIVQVKFYNREIDYNEDVVEVKDDDNIAIFGERPMPDPVQLYEIVDPAVARFVAQTILQRQLYSRLGYRFKLGPGKSDFLEPMDLVTLTSAKLNLSGLPVRIREIQELGGDDSAEDGFEFLTREEPANIASSVLYPIARNAGYATNFNAPAGSVNTPVIFDAPGVLCPSGYELWIAVSGASANWGGCQVWVATDSGGPYKQVGAVYGPARHGVLSATFAAGADPDTTHTAAVDLTVSGGELTGGTQADADNLSTLSWIEGELISFETATLTAANQYDLKDYLRRGVYNTGVAAHAAGERFVRLDQALGRYQYTPDMVGSTVYVKLPSFNVYGFAIQDISEVAAVPVVIAGPIGAPSNVTGFTAQQAGDAVIFNCDAIADQNLDAIEVRRLDFGDENWNNGIPLTNILRGKTSTSKAVPEGNWTFLACALDLSGKYSLLPTRADLLVTADGYTKVIDREAAPDWLGTLTNMVRHYSGAITVKSQTPAGLRFAELDTALVGDYGLISQDLFYSTASAWKSTRGTIGKSTGKWEWQVRITKGTPFSGTPSCFMLHGIRTGRAIVEQYNGADAYAIGYYAADGQLYSGAGVVATGGARYGTGDVLTFRLDLTAGYLYILLNGSLQYTVNLATYGLTGQTIYPGMSIYYIGDSCYFDSGKTGSFTPAAGYAKLTGAAWAPNLIIPGVAGQTNYVNTPDTVANSITGDLEVQAHVLPTTWAPAYYRGIACKWAGAPQVSWWLGLDTTNSGKLAYYWSPDGSATYVAVSTVAMPVTDGTARWVKLTHDVNNGAGGNDVKFWTSPDGVVWTQLGATVTTAGTTAIYNSTASVEIGSHTAGASYPFKGRIFRVKVYNGIGGTLVNDFDPSLATDGAATVTAATGEVWTVHTSGDQVARIDVGPTTGLDWEVFDQFVADPYPSGTYETPELDKLVDGNLRVYGDAVSALGPGETTGLADPKVAIDYRLSAGSYDGFEDWIIGFANFRFMKARLTLDTAVGNAAITGFRTVAEGVSRQEEHNPIAVGPTGTTVTFNEPFHLTPTVVPRNEGATPLIPTISGITNEHATIHLHNSVPTEVGGTGAITVTGV